MSGRLHYQYTKVGKETILFLHGFMGSLQDWKYYYDNLNNHYSILGIDLPGHGGSLALKSSDYTMESVCDSIIHILDELDIERTNIVAYSMGGRVAIALLHKYSERFHKVVLESCTPGIDNAIERDKRKVLDANLAKKITTIPLEEFLKSWYDNPLWGNIRQHKNFEHLLQKRLNNSVSKLAQSLVSMGTGTQESYWDAIKTFQFSTIFIAGEQDLKYTAIGKQMCASNKHIQLTIVPAAAHNIHFEKEHTFLAILNKFFT